MLNVQSLLIERFYSKKNIQLLNESYKKSSEPWMFQYITVQTINLLTLQNGKQLSNETFAIMRQYLVIECYLHVHHVFSLLQGEE